MTEKDETRPTCDRAGQELAADQGSSSLEVYDGTPPCCTVCGRPDDNLSIPFGRCLPCIKAASAAWSEEQRARIPVSKPRNGPCGCVHALRKPCGAPMFYQLLFPCEPPRPTSKPLSGGATPSRTRARIAGLLRRVNEAAEGERNTVLYWASCRVAEMIAAGELADVAAAADTLASVGLAVGLTPAEVRGTIRSGFGTSGVHL